MVKHVAFVEEVGAVGDGKGLAHIMVGDKDAYVAFLEVRHNILYVLHGDGVDTGERFVEQQEHGVVGKGTRYLCAASLTTAELYTFALADMLQPELIEQRLQLLTLLFFGKVFTEFKDGPDVVFH